MLLNRVEESSSRTGLLYYGSRFETRALALIKFGDFFKF